MHTQGYTYQINNLAQGSLFFSSSPHEEEKKENKYLIEGYSYGFQGQEVDDEVKGEGNSVNYKYRMHDPRVGRFFAVDPLESKYPFWSPYAFSGNQVVHSVEIEGLETEVNLNYNEGSVVITQEDGQLAVTAADLRRINTLAGGNVSTFIKRSETTFSEPGGYIGAQCVDCHTSNSKSTRVYIKLPTEKVVRTILVDGMVPKEIKGKPGSEGFFEPGTGTKSQDFTVWEPGYIGIPGHEGNYGSKSVDGVVDYVDNATSKAVSDVKKSIGKDNFVGIKSIDIVVPTGVKDIANVEQGIKDRYGSGVSINITQNFWQSPHKIDVKVEYDKKIWVPGTKGDPDKTIMVPGKVEKKVTVEPVEVKY